MNILLRNKLGKPLMVHLCILQCKRGTAITTSNFFRDGGNPTSPAGRGRDFNLSLSGNEMNRLHINTDKYVVLQHSRIMLGALNGADQFSDRQKANYKMINKYITLNKQLRYDDDEGTECATPLYFVYWADSDFNVPLAASEVDAWTMAGQITMFFRENPTN